MRPSIPGPILSGWPLRSERVSLRNRLRMPLSECVEREQIKKKVTYRMVGRKDESESVMPRRVEYKKERMNY